MLGRRTILSNPLAQIRVAQKKKKNNINFIQRIGVKIGRFYDVFNLLRLREELNGLVKPQTSVP